MTLEGKFGLRLPHEPSRMRLGGPVSIQDVLDALVGRGSRVESTFGSQLESQRDRRTAVRDCQKELSKDDDPGMHSDSVGCPWRARDAAEASIVRDIRVVRCLTDLQSVKFIPGVLQPRGFAALLALQNVARHKTHGSLIYECMSAYHEWVLVSKERALAEVFAWSRRLSGADMDALSLAQDFREGRAAPARRKAATLVTDGFLALDRWVGFWNRTRAK